ncbi:MAG: hypothetical protein KDJ14_11015 [Xanthomonadales bacterium]|nr:hypothetical protein [Xanthomonadales bacterium]
MPDKCSSKSAVDRTGKALRDGNLSEETLVLLEDYRQSFDSAYRDVVGVCTKSLRLSVVGRPAKSTPSIVDKLRRQSIRLSQIQDIAGCRIVVPDRPNQESVVFALGVLFRNAEIDSKLEVPTHGYRAVHVIVPGDVERLVEIQVRTRLQHLWAELSEKLADLFDPLVKYGRGPEEIQKFLILLSDGIRYFEDTEMARDSFFRELSRLPARQQRSRTKEIRRAERSYKSQRERLLNILSNVLSDDFGGSANDFSD